MKVILFATVFVSYGLIVQGQQFNATPKQAKDITLLIDQYSKARETNDTVLLKEILTIGVDQLVSTGEWRYGLGAAVAGMQQSTASNPGSRTLTVENIRLLTPGCAIVDCRYTIKNDQGNTRLMWSTFSVVQEKNKWKIAAIRNMLPAAR